MRYPRLRRFAVGSAVALLAVFSAPQVLAHDTVVGGVPADGEQVAEFPEEIALEFSGYVNEGFNTFAISDADTDEVLFSGEPVVNERWVTLEVPEGIDPGPGNYRIGFQITSSDGHATRGMTNFSVEGATEAPAANATEGESASEETAEAASETEQAEQSGISPWVWAVGGIVLVVIAVGGIMAASKNRK
ncbi:copper resistance CopC family protein [Corynebacterium lubricantis]|uniref:copper resistance CopC family protein n=1 Tax=Corynebacterium lubricantis TaxID=541095 RepID=UPI00036D1DF6|nr:copper resistance protein CopC [Corynebacterium lubricantis]